MTEDHALMPENRRTMNAEGPPSGSQQPPRWQPVRATDRRVLGVLVEKAKTTPDSYPLSLNALRTGCNQKSNRFPVMQLGEDEIAESLARLRELGAVGEVQGSGRVYRYRHYLYEWLGVDKIELAVMAELLLRGPQTEGELRARAARMEPLPDLNALRPVLDSLKSKGLVVPLTSQGRGHTVTHALHEPAELEEIRAGHSAAEAPGSATVSARPPGDSGTSNRERERELDEQRSLIAELRSEVERLTARLDQTLQELERVRQQGAETT